MEEKRDYIYNGICYYYNKKEKCWISEEGEKFYFPFYTKNEYGEVTDTDFAFI